MLALKAPSPEAMVGLPPAMLTVVALWVARTSLRLAAVAAFRSAIWPDRAASWASSAAMRASASEDVVWALAAPAIVMNETPAISAVRKAVLVVIIGLPLPAPRRASACW
jgi:hypothetical protein